MAITLSLFPYPGGGGGGWNSGGGGGGGGGWRTGGGGGGGHGGGGGPGWSGGGNSGGGHGGGGGGGGSGWAGGGNSGGGGGGGWRSEPDDGPLPDKDSNSVEDDEDSDPDAPPRASRVYIDASEPRTFDMLDEPLPILLMDEVDLPITRLARSSANEGGASQTQKGPYKIRPRRKGKKEPPRRGELSDEDGSHEGLRES